MHLPQWNPLSHCVALILNKKPQKKNGSGRDEINTVYTNPSIVTEFLDSALENVSVVFESEDSIPDFDQSLFKFLAMYPDYKSTEKVDYLRSDEYSNLSDQLPKVCLDYCGFGLFSFLQTVHYWESCTFNLTEITANLTNHALYGGAVKGTMENDVKVRILEYMNVPEHEYEVVFTVSRGSAFKLLAESYPFETCKNLLTMFDHESQSVNWMAQFAKQKGAKVQSASFKWPTLEVSSTDLRNQITGKKKNKNRKKKHSHSGTGLFVFPGQSRVTGSKYSYQWMSLAQQNDWHVLLDAGALGPKDMDSLGLSLFRPEFIITSFYRVFGYDPSGFGCLLIKKSVIGSLQNQPGHTGSGIVKINPVFPLYLSDSLAGSPGFAGVGIAGTGEVPENGPGPLLPAFSGAYTSDQVKEVFDIETDDDKYSDFEENESFLIEDVLKSPVFSEDDSPENSLWINLGRSPAGSDTGGDSISTSPQPPFWFATKNKIEHPKSTTVSQKISEKVSQNVYELKLNNHHDEEIEEAKICSNSESAIRRETEGEFRLLGNREPIEAIEEDEYTIDEFQDSIRQEPEIQCRHLDHVEMLGLNKTTLRIRSLINWLVASLLQLRTRSRDETLATSVPLVQIYGPKVKHERGGSVAFNIRDRNRKLIDPEIVQKLAETNGIGVGIAILSRVRVGRKGDEEKSGFVRVEVVTASLGFLSSFGDVYRLWEFVARFRDPAFSRGGLPTVVEDE